VFLPAARRSLIVRTVKLWYDPGLKWLARDLRNNSTLGEILLGRQLKRRQRGGFEFQRQKPIGSHIVDFFSAELMLAIEIDGGSHKLKAEEDDARQRALERLGIRFLRFREDQVRRDLDAVVRGIDSWIEANKPKA
jgi:very-short-patch-repair endonuclease